MKYNFDGKERAFDGWYGVSVIVGMFMVAGVVWDFLSGDPLGTWYYILIITVQLILNMLLRAMFKEGAGD